MPLRFSMFITFASMLALAILEAAYYPRIVDAQAPDPEPPEIRIFVLEEDIPLLPSGAVYHESISRAAFGLTFPPGGGQIAPHRWLLMSDALASQIPVDTWLFDNLWDNLIAEGYGLFVTDKTSGDVANLLDLSIPQSEGNVLPDALSVFIGSAIRIFPNSDTDGTGPAVGSDDVFSASYVEDAVSAEFLSDTSAADYSLLATAMARLTALNQDSPPEPPAYKSDDVKFLGCKSDGLTFQYWPPGSDVEIDDPFLCPWGEIYVRTCAWGMTELQFIACAPICHPGTNCPTEYDPLDDTNDYTWATRHTMEATGSGSQWRPWFDAADNKGVKDYDCHDNERWNYLGWARHGESFQGLHDAELLVALPDVDVTSNEETSSFPIELKVEKGPVTGTVDWVFNNGKTWVLQDHSVSNGIASWENDFITGSYIPGQQHNHPDCPGSGGVVPFTCSGSYRNNPAFVGWRGWPGANWHSELPVLVLGRKHEKLQPIGFRYPCGSGNKCDFPYGSVCIKSDVSRCVQNVVRPAHKFNWPPLGRIYAPVCPPGVNPPG